MLELDGRSLAFKVFRELCLEPNRPAIIRQAVPESEDTPNAFYTSLQRMRDALSPESLMCSFGASHSVPVTSPARHACAADCRVVPFAEVMERWRCDADSPYLKDWHMQSDVESLEWNPNAGKTWTPYASPSHGAGMYRVPFYLGADWMDAFCRQRDASLHGFGDERSDYRFAYIGPPSTWTPLHFDVFGTFSWSLNVCGEKLWYFPASPEDNARLLATGFDGIALPTDIRVTTGVELLDVLQKPGDLVFVPSGYLHQVHNTRGRRFPIPSLPDSVVEGRDSVELVISVNHNWCNEWCVGRMVEAFCRDVLRLRRLMTEEDRKALFDDDLMAWHDHVERMLMSGTNWNFVSMRSFLKFTLGNLDRENERGTPEGEKKWQIVEQCLERVNAMELCVTGIQQS